MSSKRNSTKTAQADHMQSENKASNDVGSPGGFSEDEVVTWLQYPLDDAFEKSYCSDLFGQWPSTTTGELGDCGKARTSEGLGNAGSSLRSANAEAALALGAGRAAGLVPQAGLDAFKNVRTCKQPPPSMHSSKICASVSSSSQSSHPKVSPQSEILRKSPSMLPPKFRNSSPFACKLPPPQSRPSNVANPSRTLVEQASDGLLPKLDRTKLAGISGSNVSESRKDSDLHLSSAQQSGCSLITEEAMMRVRTDQSSSRGHLCTSPVDANAPRRLAQAVLESERTEKKLDVCEVPEMIAASCSGGSQTSTDLNFKEVPCRGKRKAEEDSEYLSDDAEGESSETKPPRKCSSSRRNRAAAVHNLSEKRRRNRINEKMKALQELIPNSNKTDKASMLDEAIEYLKALQLQLQMVSMRNGVNVSPAMLPVGMPHLQMPQMAAMQPMGLGVPVAYAGMGMGMGIGMGMGMGMGVGMGMMDFSHASTTAPFHSLPTAFAPFSIPVQVPTTADFQTSSQTSSQETFNQPFEPVSMDAQCASHFQLDQQQGQPQQPNNPSHLRLNGISESSNEQI